MSDREAHRHHDAPGHGHEPHQGHQHGHSHPAGLGGVVHRFLVPHSHDAADSIDDALVASAEGIRAVKVSLVLLLLTTAAQAVIVAMSGSVALFADTIHNFSDAMTAVPLWIAFVLGRRAATRRYTYGFDRAEDLAGLFIVAMIALSAVVALWQSVDRLIHPRPIEHLGWVLAAGVVGFIGNEAVAIYRIRTGRRIGSAALVADGVHARADGFTSLAVVLGALGVLAGFPLADPLVGLAIAAMIGVLLIGTVRSVGRRLMDGVEPELVDQAERALDHVPGLRGITSLRLRWVGHRLYCDAAVLVDDMPLAKAQLLAREAEDSLRRHLPKADEVTVRPLPIG